MTKVYEKLSTSEMTKVEPDHSGSTYFGLPEEFSSLANSQVVILPVPYEATTSYGQGTKNGPQAIAHASQQVELFDEELWSTPYKIGIHSAEPLNIKPVDGATRKPFGELEDKVSQLLEAKKFPLILGGEHALSFGAVAACAKKYANLSVLQIDAHADCRSSYEGNPFSHASVTYQMNTRLGNLPITEVGIRNISEEEVEWMDSAKPAVKIFWAHEQESWDFDKIIDTLSDNVYLTVDVDGLDCQVMPSTGTPEPGGMSWFQLTKLIKLLCAKKNLVAADIVELSPIAGLNAPDFLTAKLAYKIISYRFNAEMK
jgi:agmatinase